MNFFTQNHTKLLNSKGISLIELMIVVAVVAVLAMGVIPSTIDIGPKARMKSAVRDLKSNLELARMEAAKRNRSVYAQFTPGSCSGSYTNSGWYELVIDEDKDGVETTDPRIVLFGTEKKAVNRTKYTMKAGTALCLASNLRFNSRGFPVDSSGNLLTADQKMSISSRYKAGDEHPQYTITVSTTGNVSVALETAGRNRSWRYSSLSGQRFMPLTRKSVWQAMIQRAPVTPDLLQQQPPL